MSQTRIIPAIDLIDGKCVRLEKGNYEKKKIYHADPLEVAKNFEAHGIQYLHLVDLDGAKAGKLVNHKVIEEICSKTNLSVDIGGGIKSEEDVKIAMNSGVKQINIGSMAVKNPERFKQWISSFGSEMLILSADVFEGMVAINGWQTVTDIRLEDFIQAYLEAGIKTVVCTDISRDGMLGGPAVGLYNDLMTEFPEMKLVASGGVSSIDDVIQLIDNQLDGVIIGKAIYEGRISLEELNLLSKK